MNIRSIRIHHQLKPFYFASNIRPDSLDVHFLDKNKNIKSNLLKNFFNRSFMWKNLYNESDEMFFKLRRIYCIIGGLSLLKIAKFRIEKKLLVIFCRRFIPKKNKKKFSKKIKTLKGIEDELEHFKSVVYGDNIKITRRKNWLNLCSFLVYVNVFLGEVEIIAWEYFVIPLKYVDLRQKLLAEIKEIKDNDKTKNRPEHIYDNYMPFSEFISEIKMNENITKEDLLKEEVYFKKFVEFFVKRIHELSKY